MSSLLELIMIGCGYLSGGEEMLVGGGGRGSQKLQSSHALGDICRGRGREGGAEGLGDLNHKIEVVWEILFSVQAQDIALDIEHTSVTFLE